MRKLILAVAVLILFRAPAAHAAVPITIGVLSHRGDEVTLRMWSKTADYITSALPGYWFQVVPLDFDEVETAVAERSVDFVLVNPAIYVNLEVNYRVSRIATLNNRRGGLPGLAYNLFGGVVFTRADQMELTRLADLKGKSLMAVDRTSLGGFQMALRELRQAGIDPAHDLDELQFAGTHDRVVMAVREGRIDAGTVRTDILERMASEGSISLDEFRIINSQSHAEFPFAHSTRLYPEWPFSKLQHTSNNLAQKVAVVLLSMPPDHPAAIAGRYAGWTVPLDYQPVHELLKELRLPPYHSPAKFTFIDVIHQYWYWFLFGAASLLSMVGLTTWVMRLNTEVKKAQKCLEQRHEMILNSVADGIYGVDLNGNSTFVNRAMERITGWKAEDVIGRNQHQILHHSRVDGSHHPALECPVYATFRDSVPRYVDDDVFWRKDGSCFPVEYTSTPVQDEKGNTIGAVVVFRDITERRRVEERVRQHQAELARVARLSTVGEMASAIAHELNQPLSAIANYTRACIRAMKSDGLLEESPTEVMERVAAQAERAGEVIRQIRQFVRKEEPQRQPVDLNAAVRELGVLIEPEARRARVLLQLVLDSSIPRVSAQAIQIQQVIINLARNAIAALKEVSCGDRRVMIRTQPGEGGGVVVTVHDTGPGISAEKMSNIFDPFYTTKADGMGLGLSISRGIVEAHGGTLSVESTPGQGALFRFTLTTVERERDE